jgi:hypothetical protein
MKRTKMPADPNKQAKSIADTVDAILDAWPEPVPAEKDPGRVERGRVSGAKGGKVRAKRLTPERRQEIARKAAAARCVESGLAARGQTREDAEHGLAHVLALVRRLAARSTARSSPVRIIKGNPTEISTSYIERQNLTMRMGMRRFTRLANGFSKKIENHAAAVSIHFMYMNFARPHKSLANPYPRTPAMTAGLADHVWTCEEIAALLD